MSKLLKNDKGQIDPLVISSKFLKIEIQIEPFAVKILDSKGKTLLEEEPASLVYSGVPDLKWFNISAWYFFSGKPQKWIADKAAASSVDNNAVHITLGGSKGEELARIVYRLEEPDILRCSVEVLNPPEHCRIRQTFKMDTDDRFFGFGERMNSAEQRGRKVPVWVEEGAIGLGETLGSILRNMPWHPILKGPLTSYAPMPWHISNRGFGFLIDGYPMTEYDLGSRMPDRWSVTHWSAKMSWVLFYGPDPKQIIKRFTDRVGRCTLPKPWIFAPWNDAVSGPGRLEKVARTCRENKIPSSAIWSEDWQGGYRTHLGIFNIFPPYYKPDRSLYPRMEENARELHENGFKWFAYFMPYVFVGSEHFREAAEKGYLAKNSSGAPALVTVVASRYGIIDLTNPDAVAWIKQIWNNTVDIGFDGWMHDFGEYTPPDAIFHNGKKGWEIHNQYPLLWQQAVREFFDERRPDGDYCFFCRSAFVGSQKYFPVFWSGDSNTDFEISDGLPSNLPAALSAGLSGIPVWTTDIAGYMSPTFRTSTRELFRRWTQLGAMCPVMRTHHGVHMYWNHHFDHDGETLAFYGDYARFHTALFPLFYSLVKEASENGLPVMRHLMLHYPDDANALSENFSFMLGPDFLVAPVVEKGARSRKVYLPAGTWADYWTGARFEGGKRHIMPAPIDRIPIFIKTPAVLVTYDQPVDTLVENAKPPLIGFEQADSSMRVTLFGPGEARAVLWDETEAYIICEGEPARFRARRGKAGPPRKDFLSPIDRGAKASFEGDDVRFEILDSGGNLIGKGRVKGPKERVYTIAIR